MLMFLNNFKPDSVANLSAFKIFSSTIFITRHRLGYRNEGGRRDCKSRTVVTNSISDKQLLILIIITHQSITIKKFL